MTVRDVLDALTASDRLVIRRGDNRLYDGYVASTIHEDKLQELVTARVKKLDFYPEIRHRQYKERGLTEPMHPEDTPAYMFKDLVLRLYYIIDI